MFHGRVFFPITAAAVFVAFFSASFESDAPAEPDIPPPRRWRKYTEREEKDLDEMLCSCPDLDPCEVGNYQMEVYDLMRKCFKTCPRLQTERCTAIPLTERDHQERIEFNHLKYSITSCYLNAVRFDKADFKREFFTLRSYGCGRVYEPLPPIVPCFVYE